MRKYCLDTNYLLRYIVDDIPSQVDEVVELLDLASEDKVECFISVIVQMELFFVLSSFYNFDKSRMYATMQNIYKMDFLNFEYVDQMRKALELYLHKNLSIQDSFLIVVSKTENMELKTFDKKAKSIFDRLQI